MCYIGLTVPIACFLISHPALHDLNIPACDSYPAKQNRHAQFSQTTWLENASREKCSCFLIREWIMLGPVSDVKHLQCSRSPCEGRKSTCSVFRLTCLHATISTPHMGQNGGRSDESDCQSYSGLAVPLRILT